jgi:hypothetical protein
MSLIMSAKQMLTPTVELPQTFDSEHKQLLLTNNNPLVYIYRVRKLEKKYFTKAKNNKTPLVKKSIFSTMPRLTSRKVYCGAPFFNMFITTLNVKSCVQVEHGETLGDVCYRYNIPVDNVWATCNTKPINFDVPLHEYCIGENAFINLHERLQGGSENHPYRLYTHVFECEKQVLNEDFSLQGEFSKAQNAIIDSIMNALVTMKNSYLTDKTEILDSLENFFQVVYWFQKCDSMRDYTVMLALAHKLMLGTSINSQLLHIFGITSELQGEFTEYIKQLRDLYTTTYGMIGKDSLLSKVRKVYTYLLVCGILRPLGLALSEEDFLKMESRLKYEYSDHTSMVFVMFDTALTICERVDAYLLTGDARALIHNDLVYAKWAKEADRILGLGPFTSNLGAHGTTYFAFIADLANAIETGEAICGYTRAHSGTEGVYMRRKLDSLRMLKNVEVTRRSAQKERKAPFGVLIHGGSSVAKSTFSKMLFYYYGKLHKLKVDDHFRYVRSPTEEYWSNFDSSKWCIHLDDIAFMLPAKSSEIDPTMKEMLNVINNVPYVPSQAALEDKGKTPVLADLVTATTNVAHLNAQEYFYCPLAVRRRLPFVVNIQPKEEYLAANNQFINPASLPEISTAYPDYWIITLQKVVPIKYQGRDSAKLETIAVYTDVREFLKAFGKASVEHLLTQEKALKCDSGMREIDVCRECYAITPDCTCKKACQLCFKTECTCTQGNVMVFWAYFSTWLSHMFTQICGNLLSTWIFIYGSRFYAIRAIMMYLTRFLNASYELRIAGLINSQRNYTLKITVGKVVAIGKVLASIFVAYKLYEKVKPKSKPEEEYDEQGNVFGSTEAQLAKEESQNVWYNPTIEMCRFDIPLASQSVASADASQIRNMFAANCVHLTITGCKSGVSVRTRGTFIKSQWLLLNKHIVDWTKDTRIRIDIVTNPTVDGVTPNISFYHNVSEFKFRERNDMALIEVRGYPPMKNLMKYWATQAVTATQIVSLRRETDGTVSKIDMFNGSFSEHFPVTTLNREMSVYFAKSSVPTKVGDCGSLAIAKTPMGPVIIGQHMLGHETTAGFPQIIASDLEEMMSRSGSDVCAGTPPTMSLNGDVELQPPHHRSLLRYLETGVARVYGSLPGFRAKPKSRVCATPLQEEMCDHFNTKVEFGPPVMTGWAPWKKNVVEMMKPYNDIDNDLLASCVDSFTKDILSELGEKHDESWKRELVFLSDRASVNGLPGVKYVDKMNTNTSMGFPWATTKKRHLIADVTLEYPEGVTFTDEIWERVRDIEATYERGERHYPVFTGHLKDEPTAQAKIEAQKTRVFTGAPVDWSIVVRSRLLSFVRLLQKNKFIFEAGPGTVCQSIEWTTIHEYLTAFGADRIVAGDYGKFDKRMLAQFVLAAFEIIENIYREAGFSPEECRQIRCIAMDTAFPVINMNGDIIEFYGTNPSGHPLTVIVNSIVNSLYMRYAYAMANPKGRSCDDFKQCVHLFTYGDDNIMGVSEKVPWFNHCEIQKQMQLIGVEYTMADKESESVPYIHLQQTSFLKRAWRWEEDLQAYVCPLEEKSLHKSLTTWVPSKTIDKHMQMVAVISSANSEYFFHGKEIFHKHHEFFKTVLQLEPYKFYVEQGTLPDWDALCERFRKASGGLE